MSSGFLQEFFKSIKIGQGQSVNNITIFPLFFEKEGNVDYIPLSKALKEGFVIVEEVNKFGHVPELLVSNNSDKKVLMLEGEELIGAKQNRILNTTILLREKSKTVIPVSCTEAGRWHYKTRRFADSGFVAFKTLRKDTRHSVHYNLKRDKKFRSDQRKVWNDIDKKAYYMRVDTETGAMRDIYVQREKDYEKMIEGFKLLEGQKGLFVFINGKVAGFDFVSKSDVYKLVHNKLLKSYILDAIGIEPCINKNKVSEKDVREFFETVGKSEVEKFESVGYGIDYRFNFKDIYGSILFFRNEVIHASFLQ